MSGTTGSEPQFGGWQDAENLWRWSFLQRTPQQRLDWRVHALSVAYECGALKPTRPDETLPTAPR
jgi:hypothetical protein